MKVLLILSLIFSLSGCATMFSDREDEISFESEPSGAKVYKGSDLVGTTPFKKSFRRDTFDQTEFTVKKDGYETKTVRLEKKFNGTSLLNLVFIFTTLGVTSWGVDAASGRLIEYSPRSYLIELKKAGATSAGLFSERALFLARNMDRFKQDVAQGNGEALLAYSQLSGLAVEKIRERSTDIFLEDNPVRLARMLTPASRMN